MLIIHKTQKYKKLKNSFKNVNKNINVLNMHIFFVKK